uniref:Ty3 transposon capsid-like protein domain-containing protein n=1 Tax=Oryzias latipes TaxID=8090 RepID=A0A3B3HYN0_ORYLA
FTPHSFLRHGCQCAPTGRDRTTDPLIIGQPAQPPEPLLPITLLYTTLITPPYTSQAGLTSQEWMIRQQEEQLSFLRRGLLEMSDRHEQQLTAVSKQIEQLAGQIQHPPSSHPLHSPSSASVHLAPVQTSVAPAAQLARPERFSGDSGDCRVFITQCELHFELQAVNYPTDRSRVAFIISHLTGRAGAWATAEWQRGAATCASLPAFLEAFTLVFQHTKLGREAARALMRLRQRRRRVADYAVGFRTLALEIFWNPAALTDAFLEGLSEEMKDHLAPLDLPSSLELFIALAIRIDNRLQDCRRGRQLEAVQPRGHSSDHAPHYSPPPAAPTETPAMLMDEPMQLGRDRLSPSERVRRMTAGECLYCGQLGLFCRDCPNAAACHSDPAVRPEAPVEEGVL